MSAIVAIVGRPNVGKSTFFNRLIKRREAIVDAVSGVTRDRHYGKTDWNGVEFSVIDTGGYLAGGDDTFQKEIDKQVNLAIDEADAIIFMVNVEDGLTGMDESVAALLRKSKKPVFVVVNKVDSNNRRDDAHEFYALGFEHLFSISSINGSGTGDLLDELVKSLPEKEQKEEENLPRFAVVGRPNAGKSSFINALIGEDRYIVTDIAGTTRDAIDTRYNRKGIVILVNKWDLVEKENNTAKAYEAAIRKEIEPFTDVPIIFVSALNKQRIYKAIETAVEVYNNRTKRIPTRQLNEVMLPIIENYPPPAIKGKYVKIKFCTQLPTPMPQFAFFANLPQYVKDPYRRFIENKLRENFDFKGVPIDVYFRQK